MRHHRVTGVADQSEHLSEFDMVTAMHLDAAGLQMGIEGIVVAAEMISKIVISKIKDHAVSVGIGQRNTRGIFSGSLFGLSIDDGCDDSVRDCDGGLTEDGVAPSFSARGPE